jgi:hypothetical protein
MVWQRTKFGGGAAALGLVETLGLAVLPVAPIAASASATIATSAICEAYKAEVAKSGQDIGTLTTVEESGKWPAIRKAVLSVYSSEVSLEKRFASTLSGASAKDKAAVAVTIQLFDTYKSIVRSSKSLGQYDNRLEAAASSPKVNAADKILNHYLNVCVP